MKKVLRNLKVFWCRLLVFWGFRIWVKRMYARPKYQYCVFHGCKMKRIQNTPTGARYWCKKCQSGYHLEGAGSKIIPLWQRTKR